MKKIISLLLVMLSAATAWAQGGSGAGYDPSNPPDPQANYKLTVQGSPANGGDGRWGSWMQEVGSEVYLWASPREGYTFRAWMKGDEVVSKEANFYYTMPKENVVLTAWFDFTGYGEYNPSNPGDPFADGYMHWVRSYVTPSTGGWISNNNFRLLEGQSVDIYAHANSGYRFSNWKKDGKIISTNPTLEVKMGESNLEYTATFVYDPVNPKDPGSNSWNKATGELIIDSFEPGNLWSTVWDTLKGEDFDKVDSFIVIGKISPYDFNVSNNFANLVTADYSRTSGASFVPYTGFSHLYSLTKLYLPSSILSIEYAGLDHLTSLSELIIYAEMPPDVEQNSFWYMPDDFVVRVYSGSVDLYENADIWENYRIMTIDEDSTALTVNLPEDAKGGTYKNASLQLNNLASGKSQKLVINDKRTTYTFGNLIPNMKYGLYVLAPNGSLLGQYPEFELPEEGMEYTFNSLKHIKQVQLSLLTPEGDDVAQNTTISWFDNKGKVIGSGITLPGQVTGDVVSYSVTLPQEYGVSYEVPEKGTWTVNDSVNLIKVQLVELAPIVITGYIRDNKAGTLIPDAYITITQVLNGNYTVSTTVTSDIEGKFTLKFYNAPGTVTAGASDYLEATVSFDNAEDLIRKAASLLLEAIGGTEVNISLLKRENILKNSTDNAFTPYNDHANVEYSVKNLTSNREESFIVKYPRLILSNDVKDGEKLVITATPGKSNLNPASEEIVISSGKADVKFAFTTNGDIKATYKESHSPEVIALLYDGNGKLQSSTNYEDKIALFKYVPAGSYTLVTVKESKMFSSLATYSDLESLPFEAGKDYLVNTVKVEDGYITPVDIDTVPDLDETLAYATTPETSVSVNKINVTVGATVTVRSKVEFLPDYKDVEKVKIIFTIPEGCEYVDNSLLVAGGDPNFTTTADGYLAVDVPVKDASPRFCIIPRKSGEYRPSAVIEFEHKGNLVRQPIGAAHFTAGDFSISVPERTGTPTITARGTTTALSEVRVYDNDVYVGSTHSLSNGDWRLKFDLYKPGEDGTEHFIYGAITTPEGNKYNTVTGKTTYYHGTGILTDIEMIYGGTKIDFNYVEASTEPISYSYVPGNDMFTFKAIFRDGLGSSIKKLDFIILLSDGTRRRISGKYLLGTETWTCALSFPDVNRLPVNVKVIYSEDTTVELIDDLEAIWRCPDVIPIIDPSGYVYEAVATNRVPGVTSTIYYKEITEDNYGNVVENAVKWDAEAYAQENPLFTDEEGMYQWDVPSGYWQVRFEKEGYEAKQTEWLPVPPPQLDVNVAISQMSSPVMKKASAYPDAVQIEFDKYMQPLTLSTKNIKVQDNGKEVAGSIILVDEEEGDEGLTYASVVLFKADSPFEGKEVNLKISKVKSYAGVQMEEEEIVDETLPVESPISNIVSPEETNAYVGYEKKITVKVEPVEAAAGKLLNISLDSPILDVVESVELDEDASAEIWLKGSLPGKAQLKFSVEDIYTSEEYITEVNVDIVTAELPETSVENGSPVYRHSTVEIFTDSNIGAIYYTTDGSDPTPTTGKLYEGPVTITEATTIKAINVIDEAVYSVSDVAEFNFPLKKAEIAHSLTKGWNWVSHNLENSVKVSDLTPKENIDQILSMTEEVINDPKFGLVGNLKSLSPEEGYKIKVNDAITLKGVEDIALHPSTPYTVYSGWNWIGYHGEMEMELNHVLSTTEAEYGDVIEGREGFATYDGEKWIGTLSSLTPSSGYLFFSKSVKNVVHNHEAPKVNNLNQGTTVPGVGSVNPVDKSKYPSIMPVIAEVVYSDGVPVNGGEWEITAYCGDECRGVGVFIDGYMFMSIYGNATDEINFRAQRQGDDKATDLQTPVKFTENVLGSLENPYRIAVNGVSGIESVENDANVEITGGNGYIKVAGNGITSMIISDSKGANHYVKSGNIGEEVTIDLAPGIYFVSIVNDGVQTNQKVIVK